MFFYFIFLQYSEAANGTIIFQADITHCKRIFNIAQTRDVIFVKDNSNFARALLFA